MNVQLDSAQSFSGREFDSLIDYLVVSGFTFMDGVKQGLKPSPKTVSFRYDIHHRDIRCGYGFLSRHTPEIPATFYLLLDYSNYERDRLHDFDGFASSVRENGQNVKLGYHDSPIDNYLIEQFANGDESEYGKWLRSENSIQFFSQLCKDPLQLEEFHAKVEERFVANVEKMRQRYGTIDSMASHGGQLNQILRAKVPVLGAAGSLIFSLFSENWINQDRLNRAGLLADIEKFKGSNPLWINVSEGGGKIVQMVNYVKRFIQEEKALNILIHPAIWERDVRDGELSVLLGTAKASPSVALKESVGAKSESIGCLVTVSVDHILSDMKVCPDPKNISSVLVINPVPQTASIPNEIPTQLLADHVKSKARSGRLEYVLGQSMTRYGPLVGGGVAAMLSPEDCPPGQDEDLASRFGRWLLGMYQAYNGNSLKKPLISQQELNYFLFSSSTRSLLLCKVLSVHFKNRSIGTFIDHGGGIGFIPLIASSILNIEWVICSEIEGRFIDFGSGLWGSLGIGKRISFRKCSAVDFDYPDSGRVSVVLFAQMLYRIPQEQRYLLLRKALDALEPGGVLIINEIMNRSDLDKTYSAPLVKSNELFAYLHGHAVYLVRNESDAERPLLVENARSDDFSKSTNLVIVVKNGA